MNSWSELPRDMLSLITSLLPLSDTRRFSAVCRNWYYVAKEKRHLPQLPWLILADDETNGKRRAFNMSENKHYHFDFPELRDAFIVGSSFGWLFAVGPKLDAYLVNPFTGAKFSLPCLPDYGESVESEKLAEHVERDEKGLPRNHCFELVQHILVPKAIISADPSKCADFVVLIMLNGDNRFAFYRMGNTTWTIIDYERGVEDIVFFNGQFYALLCIGMIVIVDVGPMPKLRDVKKKPYTKYERWYPIYLVPFGTSLLLVYRYTSHDVDEYDHHMTTDFRVFKFGVEFDNMCEIKDINGHALFLSKNCSIVVRASDFENCLANSIYFSSDSFLFIPIKKYGYNDMGVYKLEDGSIEHFYPPEIYNPNTSCPIWLVPNPF